jgi:hypothetical protein
MNISIGKVRRNHNFRLLEDITELGYFQTISVLAFPTFWSNLFSKDKIEL